MGVIRQLVERFKTAQAIRAHLADTITKIRTTPVTYADLLGVLDANKVKALDTKLSQAGLDWVQRQLAGSGVDMNDDKIRDLFPDTIAGAAMVKALGRNPVPQWQEYGLTSLPTLKEVQDEIAPLVKDGVGISLAVNVTPDRQSVCLTVTDLAGTAPLGVIDSFAVSSVDDKRLTDKQREFTKALVELVTSYGG